MCAYIVVFSIIIRCGGDIKIMISNDKTSNCTHVFAINNNKRKNIHRLCIYTHIYN